MPAWTYQNDIDDMRGTTIHNAYIESNDEYTNSIGDNPARTKLFIRLKGKGLDVFVSNENLQYTCASYVDSYVSLKFDDGPVVKYQCTNSSGNKYGLAFIANEKQIVEKIKKSKRLTIETPVYQRGDIQQTFVIEGFNWEQLNRQHPQDSKDAKGPDPARSSYYQPTLSGGLYRMRQPRTPGSPRRPFSLVFSPTHKADKIPASDLPESIQTYKNLGDKCGGEVEVLEDHDYL